MKQRQLSLGDIILIVHGEAEGCSFEEKMWIAHTLLNRERYEYEHLKNYFRDPYVDYHGASRKWKISNIIERRAFVETCNACFKALADHLAGVDPTNGAVYFATKRCLRGHDPTDFFGDVEEITVPGYFQHRFFRVVEL